MGAVVLFPIGLVGWCALSFLLFAFCHRLLGAERTLVPSIGILWMGILGAPVAGFALASRAGADAAALSGFVWMIVLAWLHQRRTAKWRTETPPSTGFEGHLATGLDPSTDGVGVLQALDVL